MPYVPTASEAARLRVAIDRASFTEVERMAWLVAFAALIVLEGVLAVTGASLYGTVGAVGGFAVLFWRLRGGYLLLRGLDEDRDLHGVGLRRRDQRAFTGLMLRQVLTGRNPLHQRVEHDPLAAWSQRVDRVQVSEGPEA